MKSWCLSLVRLQTERVFQSRIAILADRSGVGICRRVIQSGGSAYSTARSSVGPEASERSLIALRSTTRYPRACGGRSRHGIPDSRGRAPEAKRCANSASTCRCDHLFGRGHETSTRSTGFVIVVGAASSGSNRSGRRPSRQRNQSRVPARLVDAKAPAWQSPNCSEGSCRARLGPAVRSARLRRVTES